MDKLIQIFNFEDDTVRIIEIDNNFWFVAKDVASTLGYNNTAGAVKNHCKCAKSLIDVRGAIGGRISNVDFGSPLSPGNQMKMILESDVYRLILKSNLPSAKKFKDRIIEEVLPSKFSELQSEILKKESQLLELQSEYSELQCKYAELKSIVLESSNKCLKLISKYCNM